MFYDPQSREDVASTPPHPSRAPVPAPRPRSPSLAQSATVTLSTTTRSTVTLHTLVTNPITGEVSRVAHAAWAVDVSTM